MNNIVHLVDCMELMKDKPDNYYDLAIVDPPYGIGIVKDNITHNWGIRKTENGLYAKRSNYFDASSPDIEYFKRLFKVSKNQIIWGANHFISKMAFDSSCWIVWDKKNGNSYFADCELAWCSFNSAVRKISLTSHDKNRIHPTQKPVALYKWLIAKYANSGDHILDTHVGSGSSRIAAYDAGLDFTGCELNYDYWLAQEERFNNHIKQARLAL